MNWALWRASPAVLVRCHRWAVDPFRRPDSASEADLLTDAALAVLAHGGLAALSVSAMARWIGVTPPALTLRWREEGVGARARILRLVVLTFGRRWHLWSRGPLMREEPSLSLPATAQEVAGVRGWLALREMARSEFDAGNPDLAAAVARVCARDRDEVRAMVRSSDDRPIDAEVAAAICAFADGLRTELVAPEPSLDVATAQRMLREYVALARRAGAPPAN